MNDAAMSDSTFVSTLQGVIGTTDDWHEYDYLPTGDDWTARYEDSKAQIEFLQSCTREGNKLANSPEATRLDRIVEAVCGLYRRATPAQRAMARPALPSNAGLVLHHFAWRMAVRALRRHSQEDVALGLTAVSIEDAKFDFRDTITSLAILHHAAERIQVDTAQLFHQAAAVSTQRTSEMIVKFLSRAPESKSLSSFKFREGSGEHGATLERS
jgi:hypothetical protein